MCVSVRSQNGPPRRRWRPTCRRSSARSSAPASSPTPAGPRRLPTRAPHTFPTHTRPLPHAPRPLPHAPAPKSLLSPFHPPPHGCQPSLPPRPPTHPFFPHSLALEPGQVPCDCLSLSLSLSLTIALSSNPRACTHTHMLPHEPGQVPGVSLSRPHTHAHALAANLAKCPVSPSPPLSPLTSYARTRAHAQLHEPGQVPGVSLSSLPLLSFSHPHMRARARAASRTWPSTRRRRCRSWGPRRRSSAP